MTSIEHDYFDWLIQKINKHNEPYFAIYYQLYDTDFIVMNENDNSRYEDGLYLRKVYDYEKNNCINLYTCLNKKCSILEMMVALAKRMEDLLYDYTVGDQTDVWFNEMLRSLGIDSYTDDDYYDEYIVEKALDDMMNYHINRNGDGGLFTVPYSNVDMRDLSIWYQMQVYCQYKES